MNHADIGPGSDPRIFAGVYSRDRRLKFQKKGEKRSFQVKKGKKRSDVKKKEKKRNKGE